MDPLASILLDQGFPVEYELDEFNMPLTGTTLSGLQYCYVDCDAKFRSDALLLRLWATFSGDIHASKQPEPQTTNNRFCPQTANMTFATLW